MNSIAVKKGCEWLDVNHPGWRTKINFDTLDLRIWSRCILGQVLGVANLIHTPNLAEHGFFCDHTAEANQMMVELWKKEINDS